MTSFISLSETCYAIANKIIFQNISININKGDRICLVGKNGAGKTTLMKILNKDLEVDKGNFVCNPKITIGYLAQKFELYGNSTIYDYLMGQLKEQDDDAILSKKYLADILLEQLDLDGNKQIDQLSGGQLRRASLAGALIIEPDLLLLDEPTNHLDIASIEWLETYLRNYQGAMIIISHDRTFLRKVTNKTFWLDRGKILTNGKGFDHFEQFQEAIYLQEEKNLQKMSRELERQESWLLYGVTARRKRNQHRLSHLINLREKLKQNKGLFANNNRQIDIAAANMKSDSKIILEFENMGFSFQDVSPPKIMFHPFSLRVLKKEIIGIVGKNGSGKTTFLRLLVNNLKPTIGHIKFGHNTNISYFDQNKQMLNQHGSVKQILCPDGGDMVDVNGEMKHVSAYLKDFMFDKNTASATVNQLSGGEQSRLLLAKILSNPGNLLILDEPTNDLDVETLDMLEEMLSEYKGTVIMVSHDRDFLDRMATRTLVFDNSGNVKCVVGGYEEYQKILQHEKSNAIKTVKKSEVKISTKTKSNNISYNLKREYELLPSKIEILTQEIADLEKIVASGDLYLTNPEKFNKSAIQLAKKKEELDNLESRWIELAELIEFSE